MDNLNAMTDDMLVGQYSSGNAKAFDILLERYSDRLFAYINFTVRDSQVAGDIFQETFLKAIVTIQKGAYTPDGKFGAWITRIAHNLMMDGFRHVQTERTTLDGQDRELLNDPAMALPTIEDSMTNGETLETVRALVDMLPDSQREVVFMRYWQDMSFAQIAMATGVSVNTALGRMRYALINIRNLMARHRVTLQAI